MAYHLYYFSAKFSKTFRTYNIDYTVGRGASNRADDAMLVQTLLGLLFYENTDPRIATYFPQLAGVEEIKVDGIIGPVTHRYIMHFKNCLRKGGAKVYPDGVMDPFRGSDPKALSPRAKVVYAFGWLDAIAAEADMKSQLGKYESLAELEDTPQPLKSALKQTRKQAQKYAG